MRPAEPRTTDFTPIPAALTVAEVASSLGVASRTVRNLIYRGDLEAFSVGQGDKRPALRVTPVALAAFIATKTVAPKELR